MLSWSDAAELAMRYMLETDASLSDIALRCGFVIKPTYASTFDRHGQPPALGACAHGKRRRHRGRLSACVAG